MKISGLDRLQKQLSDANKTFQSLDGEVATLRFDPNNPTSIDSAIQEMEAAIDQKVAPYRGNSLVEAVAGQLKAKYRQAILDRAASAADGRGEAHHEA